MTASRLDRVESAMTTRLYSRVPSTNLNRGNPNNLFPLTVLSIGRSCPSLSLTPGDKKNLAQKNRIITDTVLSEKSRSRKAANLA
jgi:hypothetical protein